MRLKEADGQRLISLCEALAPIRNDDESHLWHFDDLDWSGAYEDGRRNLHFVHHSVRPN